LDLQKKILSYHSSFDVSTWFRELDSENKGYVSSSDFVTYFQDDPNIAEAINFDKLILHWNGSKRDERLLMNDLEKAFKPHSSKSASFGGSFGGGLGSGRVDYYSSYGGARYGECMNLRGGSHSRHNHQGGGCGEDED
jgi:hypothetical protein